MTAGRLQSLCTAINKLLVKEVVSDESAKTKLENDLLKPLTSIFLLPYFSMYNIDTTLPGKFASA
jgi:hypothetical protein